MWSEATIISIEKETNLTEICNKPESKFAFKPGQFVQIKLMI